MSEPASQPSPGDPAAAFPTSAEPTRPVTTERSLGRAIREVADELVFVFILVMFIKLFLVEHYKIPTGSMTPTLIGGTVAYDDIDGDGHKDLIYWPPDDDWPETPRVFLWHEGRYLPTPELEPNEVDVERWRREGLIHEQYDHILVNKLSYWFHQPRRGDIVVFKVPAVIWKPDAPIYIKRLVGLPGEELTFTPEGRLVVDGRLIESPDFFAKQNYRTRLAVMTPDFSRQPEITYHPVSGATLQIDAIRVPPGKAYVFGDNTQGSLDSRFWGGVPLNHFKGKAFLRIYPFNQMKFF